MDDDIFGFFSFTEVTEADQHHAYNEWHQLDHLPEQYSLPFVHFGQRWVATPVCASARLASASPFDRVHYVTLYLMRGGPDNVVPEFMALGQELRSADRFFHYRRSHLAGPFDVTNQACAPRVSLSPQVLPMRPNRGIYLSLSARDSDGPPAGEGSMVSQLLSAPGVAGVWEFATHSQYENDRWDSGPWHVVVAFLDDNPLTVAPRLDAVMGATGVDRTVLTGPFASIQPWQWDWFD